MQSKKVLLDTLHQDVANKEDGGLKRLLGEDEEVAKKREASMTRLRMLEKVPPHLPIIPPPHAHCPAAAVAPVRTGLRCHAWETWTELFGDVSQCLDLLALQCAVVV